MKGIDILLYSFSVVPCKEGHISPGLYRYGGCRQCQEYKKQVFKDWDTRIKRGITYEQEEPLWRELQRAQLPGFGC